MNISFPNKRISDVIADLQKALAAYGDRYVYVSSGDYPGPYGGHYIDNTGDGYIRAGALVITK